MVTINGRPLIAYVLGWLVENDIVEVVLSCGYRWDALQAYLGNGSRWGLDVHYAVERERLGRGGGIRFAMQYLKPGADPIAVVNGDNVSDIDLRAMLARHTQTQAVATVALTPLVSARGIVETDERDRIVRFREKPELPHWINAGVYIFARDMADLLPVAGDHEDELFPRLAAEGRLYAYKTREMWRTVDTAKDITAIAQELEAGAIAAPCLAEKEHQASSVTHPRLTDHV
jgi:NDP-sugar pyrophosphorylase family protein